MDDQTAASVVFITDENYVIPTSVAMSSMISNKKLCSVYNIYILSDNISIKSKRMLKSMEIDGFNVNIVEVEKSTIEDMGQSRIPLDIHVTTAALLKFIIPELFKDKGKILYLDSDVIVKSDVMELFELDISDVYAAVVKDMKPMVSYKP